MSQTVLSLLNEIIQYMWLKTSYLCKIMNFKPIIHNNSSSLYDIIVTKTNFEAPSPSKMISVRGRNTFPLIICEFFYCSASICPWQRALSYIAYSEKYLNCMQKYMTQMVTFNEYTHSVAYFGILTLLSIN